MFEYMSCQHHVYKHVHTMFTNMLITCLHNVYKHVYTIFEDMFIQFLKTLLNNVWNMYPKYLKSYLHHVWRYAFTMFLDIFIQVLKTLLYHVWRYVFSHVYTKFGTCLMYKDIIHTFWKLLCILSKPQLNLKTTQFNLNCSWVWCDYDYAHSIAATFCSIVATF